jgi:hypothetical protein
MIEHDEKRDFLRMDTNCSITFNKPGSKNIMTGICLDLSGAGIKFETDQEIETGRAFEVCITPEKDVTPPLEILIEVIRCELESDSKWHVAASIKGIKGN